jgi:Tfp pilus assembly protein PilX
MSAPVRLHMHDLVRDQRGVALVMALLVLLVISLLSVTLLMSVNVETKVSALSNRQMQALHIAEAGVAEAVSLIKSGDIPTNNNPQQVAYIFNTVPGSVPVLGANQIALATRQPAGAWLSYTTAAMSESVLSVRYKTNAAQTAIYRYDPSLAQAVQTVSGFPIFVVTSTGRKGGTFRRIVTEVIQKPINVNAKGALVADKGIDFSGDSEICGFNHGMDAPPWTDVHPSCENWETGVGDQTGAWSSGPITSSGSSKQSGSPTDVSPGQVGFYSGPWDAFGMSQSDFFSWIGAPVGLEPSNPQGVYYLDDNGVSQDASGSFKYNGGTGEGLLYVDGDLAINGNFVFKGLVYIEGDLQINGNCWILGSIIVKGKSTIKIANGSCTVLFSEEAITQNVSKYGGQFVTLSWRESRSY